MELNSSKMLRNSKAIAKVKQYSGIWASDHAILGSWPPCKFVEAELYLSKSIEVNAIVGISYSDHIILVNVIYLFIYLFTAFIAHLPRGAQCG